MMASMFQVVVVFTWADVDRKRYGLTMVEWFSPRLQASSGEGQVGAQAIDMMSLEKTNGRRR